MGAAGPRLLELLSCPSLVDCLKMAGGGVHMCSCLDALNLSLAARRGGESCEWGQ
jgi:hypothetical protein